MSLCRLRLVSAQTIRYLDERFVQAVIMGDNKLRGSALMDWFNADPGGTRNWKPCFGVAWLRKNGMFETTSTDCAHTALRWIQKHSVEPLAIGIDCPLWWSSLKGRMKAS